MDPKQIENQLAQERNLLRTILNNLPDRIFVKNREGRYIASNKVHMEFVGAAKEEEILGKTLHDFFPPEVAEAMHATDLKVIQEGKSIINIEERTQHKDGSIGWYLTSKVPFISEDRTIAGLVGIARDITAQKVIEEKLRNTINVLNDTQLQLIEAEKLKTVGRLAAGVAHEVKNPLGVVGLGVEYLKDHMEGPPDLIEMLDDMEVAINKANAVIFELLDYSSPHEVSMQPMDINDAIRRVLGLTRHNFNKAHINVSEALTENLPSVSIDIQKMEQALINLFLNAIGAMPDGGDLLVRSYTIRMEQSGANVSSKLNELFRIGDRIVVVEIEDSGHGIAPRDRDKVFDPFYSTKPTGEGTGLGLSIIRSIVEMHRGLVTLENRKDSPGAVARLYFPTSKKNAS